MIIATWNVERLKHRKSLDKILSVIEDTQADILVLTMIEVFHAVDDTIRRCVQSIVDSIHVPGMVNVDFSEIKALLSNAGFARMGYGSAKGVDGARNAAKAAAGNSLMESAVEGATGMFLRITGGEEINLQAETDVIEVFSELTTPDAKFVWGAMVDHKLAKDEFQVTAIALNSSITVGNEKNLT